jgi:hypothetical protein
MGSKGPGLDGKDSASASEVQGPCGIATVSPFAERKATLRRNSASAFRDPGLFLATAGSSTHILMRPLRVAEAAMPHHP